MSGITVVSKKDVTSPKQIAKQIEEFLEKTRKQHSELEADDSEQARARKAAMLVLLDVDRMNRLSILQRALDVPDEDS
jgi:hypothetical protein